MIENIYLHITNRCDLHCQHCLQGFSNLSSDIPILILDKLLSDALPFGVKHIGLTGGEPYLHPEFPKIIEIITKYGYSWSIVSNGQQTDPYLPLMKQYRANFTNVNLSIDSTICEIHDEIRAQKGAYKLVTSSIKTYIDYGFSVWIKTCLNQKNKSEVKAFIELAEELGVLGIQFSGTTPTDWNQHLVLNERESLAIYQEIISLKVNSLVRIDTTSSLYRKGGVHFCGLLSLNSLSINSKGELTFCCDTQQDYSIIGSLRDWPLYELIQGWIEYSAKIQQRRTEQIYHGTFEENFDTCAFCNNYFKSQCPSVGVGGGGGSVGGGSVGSALSRGD